MDFGTNGSDEYRLYVYSESELAYAVLIMDGDIILLHPKSLPPSGFLGAFLYNSKL